MPSRRYHSKTFTGCYSCKAKHTKCDEGKPVCKNCLRRGTGCEYPVARSSKSNATTSIGEVSVSGSPGKDADPRSTTLLFDRFDLTLMHRYCTVTSLNLFPGESARRLWQVQVPEKAERYLLLQHGMLALAAMDLACTAATTKKGTAATAASYRARALHHQQVALPMFQELLRKHEIFEDKNVLFLFSVLLSVLGFGSIHSTISKPTIDDLLDVFALFRGPKALWTMIKDLEPGAELMEALFPGSRITFAQTVFRNHDDSGHFEDYESPVDNSFSGLDAFISDETSREAVRLLKSARTASQKLPGDVRAVSYFPALVSDEFIARCRRHEPEALSILRYHAVILKDYETRWWIGPWAQILADAVDAAL